MPDACCNGASTKCGGGGASAPQASHALTKSSSYQDIIGKTLHSRLKSSGDKTETLMAHARLLGVYVSASWCGPCRAFTPQLSEWYKSEKRDESCEVVFCSLDRDENSFTEYFAKMPWPHALPFGAGNAFADRFGVKGVPSLLIFTRDGTLVNSKGVEGFQRAASGLGPAFPYVWGGDSIGLKVTLQGLESRADLNGSAGSVVGTVQATERFSVRVDASGEVIAVKKTALGPAFGADMIGKKFFLEGLKREDLNGSRVHVVSADAASSRFIVTLASNGDSISVRRENLGVAPSS